MRNFLIAILISLALLNISTSKANAAEVYDVIFQEISIYNQNAQESSWIAAAIMYAADTYEVHPLLITALMEVESRFNFKAISPAGAIGLMQIMPETAKTIGVNPYKPLENIMGGTIYLKNQLNRFSGYGQNSLTYALAAYNAGPQAVIDAGGVPNLSETKNYVVYVTDNYRKLLKRVS